jgi:uncharacterized membrane protein YhiD involved in acid resistance
MILTHRSGIFGFTTAASVWLVAALEIGIGIGEYEVTIVAGVLVLVVLWIIPYLRHITRASQTLIYEAVGPHDDVRREQLLRVGGRPRAEFG